MNRAVSVASGLVAISVTCALFLSGGSVIAAPRCYPAGSRYQVLSGTPVLVNDAATGLTWQQSVAPTAMTWNAAISYCTGLAGNFRLPSLGELQTILDYTVSPPGPTIDAAFPNTPGALFWTSSSASGNSTFAWFVLFSYGQSGGGLKTGTAEVRCVR